jgi:hypothetical protein
MAGIQEIRQKIVDRRYFLSSHADEELAADQLERADLEHAIFKGTIERRLRDDPRGTRYRIRGPARDGRIIDAICRCHETGDLVIITVYARGETNGM